MRELTLSHLHESIEKISYQIHSISLRLVLDRTFKEFSVLECYKEFFSEEHLEFPEIKSEDEVNELCRFFFIYLRAYFMYLDDKKYDIKALKNSDTFSNADELEKLHDCYLMISGGFLNVMYLLDNYDFEKSRERLTLSHEELAVHTLCVPRILWDKTYTEISREKGIK